MIALWMGVALGSLSVRAQEQTSSTFNYGHILTSTTDALPAGTLALNNFITAFGISDQILIASSPWVFINYNMPMVGMRWSPGSQMIGDSGIAVEAAYMKTLPILLNMFEQENILARLSVRVLNESTGRLRRLYLCFGYQYFWNDRNPYSLRPRSWNTDRYTLSASAMAEISLGSGVSADFEGGVLGVNHRLPMAHVGLSLRQAWKWGHIQLGASVSWRRRVTSLGATRLSLEQLTDDLNSDLWVMMVDRNPEDMPMSWRPVLIHPEIQVQFLL